MVTPLVYATDFANENEETVPAASVETEVSDPVSDENSNDDVADVVDSMNDVAESAELEETAVAEEAVEVDSTETSEEPEIAERSETSEVEETEKVEEESIVAEPEVKATEVESTNAVEESVSYPAAALPLKDKTAFPVSSDGCPQGQALFSSSVFSGSGFPSVPYSPAKVSLRPMKYLAFPLL